MSTSVDVATAVPSLLSEVAGITSVELTGSRKRGDAGPCSDWDFVVGTSDFEATERELGRAIGTLNPLGALWDRLSDEPCFMFIIPGPVKIDIIFDGLRHTHEPPWTVEASTLPGIDAHFWDWSLWLTSKVDAGKIDFVRDELAKMHDHLLGPMGIRKPTSLHEAVDLYLAGRTTWETELGTTVDPSLGEATKPVIDSLQG